VVCGKEQILKNLDLGGEQKPAKIEDERFYFLKIHPHLPSTPHTPEISDGGLDWRGEWTLDFRGSGCKGGVMRGGGWTGYAHTYHHQPRVFPRIFSTTHSTSVWVPTPSRLDFDHTHLTHTHTTTTHTPPLMHNFFFALRAKIFEEPDEKKNLDHYYQKKRRIFFFQKKKIRHTHTHTSHPYPSDLGNSGFRFPHTPQWGGGR